MRKSMIGWIIASLAIAAFASLNSSALGDDKNKTGAGASVSGSVGDTGVSANVNVNAAPLALPAGFEQKALNEDKVKPARGDRLKSNWTNVLFPKKPLSTEMVLSPDRARSRLYCEVRTSGRMYVSQRTSSLWSDRRMPMGSKYCRHKPRYCRRNISYSRASVGVTWSMGSSTSGVAKCKVL